MELVNQTPVPADVSVSAGIDPEGPRVGMLVAKATFRMEPDGLELETQEPHPLYEEDEETELGLLPSDRLPRRDPVFEVVLLGAAYAPGGEPTESMEVGLEVGEHSRRMLVVGDRVWLETGEMSRPEPFTRMPLVWENAFGGSADAWFDEQTVIEMQDRLNPPGKGFDARAMARRTADAIGTPAGFPHLDYVRELPNLERPDQRVRSPEDDPDPECWATVPLDIGFSRIRTIREMEEHGEITDRRRAERRLYHRAHPAWILPLPRPGAEVVLSGVTPGGHREFELPRLRVVADYVLGDRTGSRELRPHLLALLPEEERLYLVYRSAFSVEVEPHLERSFRMRLERGWFEPGAEGGESPAPVT